MPTDIAQRFIDALHELESGGDAGPLSALYAPDAVSGNTATTRTFDGPDGAREFWSAYRETFGEIRSDFRTVVEGDDGVALEWVSTGTLAAGGEPLTYQGVTLLRTDDGLVTRSTAYFDPRALTAELPAASD